MLSKASLWLMSITSRNCWNSPVTRSSRSANSGSGKIAHLLRQLALPVVAGQAVEQLPRAREHGAREGRQAAVFDVEDAVGDVEDAVVVGAQEHRASFAFREIAEQVDDVAPGLAVERRGRLVGEDDARTAGERPRDGDPLFLAAGQLGDPGVAPESAESDRMQQLAARSRRSAAEGGGVPRERHLHVLRTGSMSSRLCAWKM